MNSNGLKSLGVGSAKNLWLDPAHPQELVVEFTNRVSVFDYGALPDAIPGRAHSLLHMAVTFFKLLERKGIKTAFAGEHSEDSLRLKRARHPKFPVAGDESLALSFIPLEVIFRWGVPEGSSLLKRRPDLKVGERFDSPLVEFSTKLESQDRMLEVAEAQSLVGNALPLAKLEEETKKIAAILKDFFKECGLELWDGKFEFAVDAQNNLHLIDAITPDELRLTVKGFESIPLSKELLRHWLSATTWAAQLRYAKKERGENWKQGLPSPPRLGTWRKEKLSSLYQALAKCMDEKSANPITQWMRFDVLKPKVCVVGGGGREAAMKWRLQKEHCEIVEKPEGADAVWVSMDSDLAQGLTDQLTQQGYWTMGPTQAASKIEWSKEYGRDIAKKAGLAIPRFERDPGNVDTFAQTLKSFPAPPVVKLDGLAAGKGVVVPENMEEALQALKDFSPRGKVLLEERLKGFEASAFFAVESGARGVQVQYLGSAKDFKRRLPNDEGPNTGGMGAYAPHPDVTPADVQLFTQWAQATAETLDAAKIPYHGILYLGLMKDEKKGWHLIEYNARFGDPETQALVLSWGEGFYLRPLLQLDLRTKYPKIQSEEEVLCLALVRPEYPDPPQAKDFKLPPWELPADVDDVLLFKAQSLNGRVAYLVAKAPALIDAGDRIFEILVESPWRSLLDWRPDILR